MSNNHRFTWIVTLFAGALGLLTVRVINAILIFALSASSNVPQRNDACDDHFPAVSTGFSLSIDRALTTSQFLFALCKGSDSESNFVVRVIRTRTESGEPAETEHIYPLTAEEYSGLIALYERALEFNALDEVVGFDGSSWCLETSRGLNYIVSCFWTPTYDAQQRGLTGIVNLGRELWRRTGMNNDHGHLY